MPNQLISNSTYANSNTNLISAENRDNITFEQWSLDSIEIENAWLLTEGKSSVRVGIIDTGVWANHEDLQDNLNTQYNVCFVLDYNTSMYDANGHGTHVTGIIGASHNDIGINGVCKSVSMTPYRVSSLSNGDGHWFEYACADSLEDAGFQGIDLINFSGSYLSDTYDLRTAFEDFDGLIVCAAGNNTTNNDLYLSESYPSTYDYDNIISVGASNQDDEPTIFTNYGAYSVDLFAPGEDICSTLPFDYYDYWDGTSMAAPLVTGTIALMKSINPSLTNVQIKNILLSTVDLSDDLDGLCVSGGRLNSYSAVKAAIPTISIGNNNCVQSLGTDNDYQWYTFAVPSGSYSISSSGYLNLSASLYSDPLSTSIQNASSDNTGNFTLNFTNNSNGTTKFYLKVVNASLSSSGSYSLSFNITHYHSYNYCYENVGLRHRAYCQCGDYVIRPHVLAFNNLGIYSCIYCGASPFINEPFGFLPTGIRQSFGNKSYILNDDSVVLSALDYISFLNGELDLSTLLEDDG